MAPYKFLCNKYEYISTSGEAIQLSFWYWSKTRVFYWGGGCTVRLSHSPVGLEGCVILEPASSSEATALECPPVAAYIRGVQPLSRHVAARSASIFKAIERTLCVYVVHVMYTILQG